MLGIVRLQEWIPVRQNSASNGILDRQATCPPLEFDDLGNDLMIGWQDGGRDARVVRGFRALHLV